MFLCFSGMAFLNSDGKHNLISFLKCLNSNSYFLRKIVLEVLFSSLGIINTNNNDTIKKPFSDFHSKELSKPENVYEVISISQKYSSVKLLLKSDILVEFEKLLKKNNLKETHSVSLFLKESLRISYTFEDKNMTQKILSSIYNMGLAFRDEINRFEALNAIILLDDNFKNTDDSRLIQRREKKTLTRKARSNTNESVFTKKFEYFYKTKTIDERNKEIQSEEIMWDEALENSKIVTEKNYRNWDWNKIKSLLQDYSSTKIIQNEFNEILMFKKLLSFFSPLTGEYKKILEYHPNRLDETVLIYKDVNFCLVDVILKDSYSIKILMDHQFLRELNLFLTQVLNTQCHKTLHLGNVEKNLEVYSEHYFKVTNQFFKNKSGILALEYYGITEIYFSLEESNSKPDIINLFLNSLDLENVHSRHVLESMLLSEKEDLKFICFQFLNRISNDKSFTHKNWLLKVLLRYVF